MVAIKNFEMPTCCVDCQIYYDFTCCPITGSSTHEEIKRGFDELKDRMEDCPLIPVHVIKRKQHELKRLFSDELDFGMISEFIDKENDNEDV